MSFLEEAHNDGLRFDVLVAQSDPTHSGHDMIEKLKDKKIQATLIPDSNIFAIMSRVNKVIIGTGAVMANGGLVTQAGNYMLCMAA